MKIRYTYPAAKNTRAFRLGLMACCKWLFLFSGFICAVVNLSVGGRAWSVIVIWGLWLFWTQLVSPDMVEYNLISQLIKLIVNACVLLALIDLLLAPGWAVEVVPVVCFSGLLAVGALFFGDFETQKQNMLPLLFLCTACLIGSIVGLIVWRGESVWAMAVMGALALALLTGCAVRLGGAFVKECRKRFCSK